MTSYSYRCPYDVISGPLKYSNFLFAAISRTTGSRFLHFEVSFSFPLFRESVPGQAIGNWSLDDVIQLLVS